MYKFARGFQSKRVALPGIARNSGQCFLNVRDAQSRGGPNCRQSNI
jgi:hypothetical protein